MWKVRWLCVAVVLAALLALPAWVQGKALDDQYRGAGGTHAAHLGREFGRPHALADAPWETNVIVNDDVTLLAQAFPSIAVDTSLNACAAWEDYRNGKPNPDIYFSYRPAGGPWGPNVRVNDDAETLGQHYPSIAVDSSLNAYVAWEDYRHGNDNPDIFFSYRPSGGSWGVNVQVNDDVGTAFQRHVSLAVDPDGNAYALWEDFRNGHYDIYFSYRPSGGAWGANVRVNDDTGTDEQWYPSISVDHDGNAYAVWEDGRDGVHRHIYFSYRPAGGSWSENVMVNDAGEANQGSSIVAADPGGNAYAVWKDGRQGNPDIYSSYRPKGGAWSANVRVNDDPGTEWQEEPFVAVDSRGNAYAVWHDYRHGEYDPDVYFSSRPAAGSWSANMRVNDDAASAWQFNPAIAVDPGGSAYVLWEDNRTDPPWAGDIYFSYLERQAWVGDRVWHDGDQDGLQEAGELGVQGILVTLYPTGGCTGSSLATHTTDSNGYYLFTSLPSGTYCLQFSSIAPWTISPPNQGADDTVDSDADPSTAQIESVIVAASADEFDQDVGLYEESEFVPELGTAAMLAAGLAGLGGYARSLWTRRQSRHAVDG